MLTYANIEACKEDVRGTEHMAREVFWQKLITLALKTSRLFPAARALRKSASCRRWE